MKKLFNEAPLATIVMCLCLFLGIGALSYVAFVNYPMIYCGAMFVCGVSYYIHKKRKK